MSQPDLFHFTCKHGNADIAETNTVLPGTQSRPNLDLPWTSELAWFTDMEVPERNALGLTSNHIGCDRTLHRWHVLPDNRGAIVRWVDFARLLPIPRGLREQLESTPGARPMHWWVSPSPIAVVASPALVAL